MQARERLSQGARDRENSTPRKRENVVVAFNALLTSLDAKLPTSWFTADELRISNSRGRQSRCKLHSLSRVAARSSFLAEAACIRISLVRRNEHRKPRKKTKMGVNRNWRAMKHFRAALVIYYLSPVGTTLFEQSSSSFIVRPQHNGLTRMFYRVTNRSVFYQ